MKPPAGYAEIERALNMLDMGEGSAFVAGRLELVDHPAATRAAGLLRQGARPLAVGMLARALRDLAGPNDGRGLGWYQPMVAEARRETITRRESP